MKPLRLLAGSVCLAAVAVCAGQYREPSGTISTASGSQNVVFTLDSTKVICAVPLDFMGLSFEKNVLATRHFDPTNRVLLNLLSNLGPGVLRFGGNAVDETYWSRIPGQTFSNAKAVLLPADLERVLEFSKRCGWRLLMGLNLAANDPEMAADEAAFLLERGGEAILAFEIGNEPEHLKDAGLRSTNYAYADYRKEVAAYLAAMHRRCGRTPLAGPATTSNLEWFKGFLADFKTDARLSTRHHYPLTASISATPDNPRFATIGNLLSSETSASSLKLLTQHEHISKQAGLPFRVAETSSASCGGKPGVSDVFASALWAADYMFSVAEEGVAGVNFHGYFSCHGYTPFCFHDGQYHVQPIYYGLLCFRQSTAGRLLAIRGAGSTNVTAHAVLCADSNVRVSLINKDMARPATVTVHAGARFHAAGIVYLAAPSEEATEGITLAGAAVGLDGTWRPSQLQPLSIVDGRVQVTLPAACAVVIVLTESEEVRLQ